MYDFIVSVCVYRYKYYHTYLIFKIMKCLCNHVFHTNLQIRHHSIYVYVSQYSAILLAETMTNVFDMSRTRSSGNIHYLLIHEWFINFIIPHIASLYILKSIVSCSILNINSASLFVSYKRVDPESVMILVNKVAGEWDSFEVTQYIFPLDPHIITPINQFFL